MQPYKGMQNPNISLCMDLGPFQEDKFVELYDLIHYFCLSLGRETVKPRTLGLLTGQPGETFFEPLPEEELQQWE